MDLASSESEDNGLACPPANFASVEALTLAQKCLRPNGTICLTRLIKHIFRCFCHECGYSR
jgi:hypothetical protein